MSAMTDVLHKVGRSKLTEYQKAERKDFLLRKLEPYLKSGLSVNKALKEAKIHNSEFYKYLAEDEFFGEKIAKYKHYISVLTNHIIVSELLRIVEKQNGNLTQNIKPQPLSDQDIKFLWWYAINANTCREEWGKNAKEVNFDPEVELQKLKLMIVNAFI